MCIDNSLSHWKLIHKIKAPKNLNCVFFELSFNLTKNLFNFNFVQIKIHKASIHSLITVQTSLSNPWSSNPWNSTKFGILRILKGHFAFVFQFYYLSHCSMKCCLSRLISVSSHSVTLFCLPYFWLEIKINTFKNRSMRSVTNLYLLNLALSDLLLSVVCKFALFACLFAHQIHIFRPIFHISSFRYATDGLFLLNLIWNLNREHLGNSNWID